jgi:hypothetical protein
MDILGLLLWCIKGTMSILGEGVEEYQQGELL